MGADRPANAASGDPTPKQVREAMRLLHQHGHDFTYQEAWTLVRVAQQRQRDAEPRVEEFDLLDALFAAKELIERASATYRG